MPKSTDEITPTYEDPVAFFCSVTLIKMQEPPSTTCPFAQYNVLSLLRYKELVAIIAMVLGAIVGTAINIDGKLNGVGDFLSGKLKKSDADKVSIAEGFVTASLLFCVGAMTIIGSLESGLKGDHTTIFTKSILDLFSSCMLSASLGIGVIFAAIFVFIFQGALVLMAGLLEPLLSDSAVAEITCVGSLMILALGFNLTGIAKFKVANYFPALIFAPLVSYLFEILGRYIPALA